MKSMQKRMLVIMTAAGLGLSSIAAVSAPWGDCGGGKGQMRGDPEQRAQMRQERRQARMEALEAQLGLNAEQQPSWQAFRAAMEAQHQTMAQHRQQKRQAGASVAQHFESRISFMEARLQGMKAVAKAADDLYQGLSAEQQTVMDDFFAKRGGRKGGGRRAG